MSPAPRFLDRFRDTIEGNLKGMLYMLGAAAVLSVMQAAMRHITQEVHPLEAVFLRGVFALFFLLPWLLRVGIGELRTARPHLQLVRVLLNAFAQTIFFWGVSITPLAEVAALVFSAPLFATIWAILILGEVARLRRWTALLVGFLGALMIVRPGFETIQPGMMMVLTSAALWSVVIVLLKILTRTDSAYALTVHLTVGMTLITFVPALFVWQAPTLTQLLSWQWLFYINLLPGALVTLVAWTAIDIDRPNYAQSLHHGEASAVMPLDFSKLVWASALGYLAFAEVPDAWTLIGGTVIFASTTYITYREASVKRERGKV